MRVSCGRAASPLKGSRACVRLSRGSCQRLYNRTKRGIEGLGPLARPDACEQSGHVEPAIGMNDFARDEAGAIGGKKNDDVGNVGGSGHGAEWDKSRLLKQFGLAVLIARLRSIGEAGGDRIDANTVRGKCQRHGAGEANNARLAGRVVGAKDVAAHRRRREIDNGTLATTADHATRERLSDEEAPL